MRAGTGGDGVSIARAFSAMANGGHEIDVFQQGKGGARRPASGRGRTLRRAASLQRPVLLSGLRPAQSPFEFLDTTFCSFASNRLFGQALPGGNDLRLGGSGSRLGGIGA